MPDHLKTRLDPVNSHRHTTSIPARDVTVLADDEVVWSRHTGQRKAFECVRNGYHSHDEDLRRLYVRMNPRESASHFVFSSPRDRASVVEVPSEMSGITHFGDSRH